METWKNMKPLIVHLSQKEKFKHQQKDWQRCDQTTQKKYKQPAEV